jgi:hypothetical protein
LVVLLVAFACAFASYAPLLEAAVDAVVPLGDRLLSNSFSLAAATSVLIFTLQLNQGLGQARSRIRLRLTLLACAVTAMGLLFAVERLSHDAPRIYALYLLVYVSFLTFTVVDFLHQTWRQSWTARRGSVRIGLRVTSVGCTVALIYLAYKASVVISLGLGMQSMSDRQQRCSSLTALPCVFSVTAPAMAVLLIAVGLTVPAMVWPISQTKRRRWEARSFAALSPLWEELVRAMPEIVLSPEEPRPDDNFLLHRRVIEINDGINALSRYRSSAVQTAAYRAISASGTAESLQSHAAVEAAVLSAALESKRAGRVAAGEMAPPAPGTAACTGDLRADTEWLVALSRMFVRGDIVRDPPRNLTSSWEVCPP